MNEEDMNAQEAHCSLNDGHSTNDDHSTNFLEKERVPSNEEIMKKTGTDEEVVINKETITNYEKNEEKKKERQEITNNKEVKSDLEEKEVEMKPEKDKHALEINKDEKKTVEIQSEMPGLNEKTDEKKSKDGEDLEIPSFLRNQSN